jgi:hypothetical protein
MSVEFTKELVVVSELRFFLLVLLKNVTLLLQLSQLFRGVVLEVS